MRKIAIILFVFLLLSCKSEEKQVISLYTNLPEYIPYINYFNNNNEKIKIIISSNINSDLVIYRGQKTSRPIPTKEITQLLVNRINKDNFYTDILLSASENNQYYVLPLTFDLNGFIYNKNNRTESAIDIEQFITEKNNIFSPFWNSNFLLWYYLASLPELTKENNFLDINEFENTINKSKNFINNREDKWDENKFNQKYLHLTPEYLINKGLIDYYFYNLKDFIKLRNSDYKYIGFSKIKKNNLTMIKDEMTYIGINKSTKKSDETENAVVWMFDINNQKNFIDFNYKKSGLVYLFNNELSTLKSITESTLPNIYPEIDSLVNSESFFTTPMNLPDLWNSLKTAVYNPIFLDSKTLNQNQWEKKYIEYFNDWSKKHNK